MNGDDILGSARKNGSGRIAFYGGSFDPLHRGHIAIAEALLTQFDLNQFVFIPAFHAPHKKRHVPTSAYDRYTMLCLATAGSNNIGVSKIEIEMPERPYSVETLSRLKSELPETEIFFVMGADSWDDIHTWREWETVLRLTNHIVVSRPGYSIRTSHVTDEITSRIVDIRGKLCDADQNGGDNVVGPHIFLTDAVNIDVSATSIRQQIRDGNRSWQADVPMEVANYIEKYQIYS
jgi:nicotinate-nucleotide adenylyltransferase